MKLKNIALVVLGVTLGVLGLNWYKTNPNTEFAKGYKGTTEVVPVNTTTTQTVDSFQYIAKIPTILSSGAGRVGSLKDETKSIVENLKVDSNRVGYIEGPINGKILGFANALRQLDDGKPLYIFIDSPGGSVVDGANFVAAMQSVKSPVYTVCFRLCASMAFIIHQYGTKRLMIDRAILMSHWASFGTQGDLERVKSFTDFLQDYIDRFSSEIAKRAKMSQDKYQNLISHDLWMDSRKAKELGFSDGNINFKLNGVQNEPSEPNDQE